MQIKRIERIPQTIKKIKTIKLSYSGKKSISVLLSDKSEANELLNRYKDRLIKAIKVINMLITRVEIFVTAGSTGMTNRHDFVW